tara:strand:+ start:287 stop:655 length:369 start_codon:yes stop_codon:yes gene_type:complete
MGIIHKVKRFGGIEQIQEYIKLNKSPKEIASAMGYKNYSGFKQALKKLYGTTFTDVYRETTGKEYERVQQKVPVSVVKRYVDCGLSVNSIADLLGFNPKNITNAFKREYSLTIRKYKSKHGI